MQKYFTRTAKGTEEVIPHPKNQFFKTKSEGRATHIIKKQKIVKKKSEVWTAKALRSFFLSTAGHTDQCGWFINFNRPARKMTADDQLCLMLQDDDIEHQIYINRERQHLTIESLEGNDL